MRSPSARAATLALLGAAAITIPARAALAYDTLGAPCDADPYYCERAALSFEHVDALPIEFDFDSGWVPAGSPLQVHVYAGLYAHTRVKLLGDLETSWPDALTLRTPGTARGGELSYHYGVETGAEGKIHISVAGSSFTWTGNIPYVPQIDFQVDASDTFPSWGFDPGKTVSSTTAPQKVAEVGLGSIVGGSIPGIDGGFELDIAVELKATYKTVRMVVETTDGQPVVGGPITHQDGETNTPYLGGPSVELDVHPEGTVDYDGVFHMIPAFYVSLLGSSWSIPIVDIPLPFPITQTKIYFDRQRAHIPLPDLVVPEDTVEFGFVATGQSLIVPYSLLNVGEAGAIAEITSSDPSIFQPYDEDVDIAAVSATDSGVRFTPIAPGEYTATIHVVSNDPSDPEQTFTVHGIGYEGTIQASLEDPIAPEDPGELGGCACDVAGSPAGGAGGGAAAGLLLVGVALIHRGRRRPRRSRR